MFQCYSFYVSSVSESFCYTLFTEMLHSHKSFHPDESPEQLFVFFVISWFLLFTVYIYSNILIIVSVLP